MTQRDAVDVAADAPPDIVHREIARQLMVTLSIDKPPMEQAIAETLAKFERTLALFHNLAMEAKDRLHAEALRSASNSGAEAMREAAAKVADGRHFLSEATDVPANYPKYHYVTWLCWNPNGDVSSDSPEAGLAAAIAEDIRALPLPAPGAPASPWRGMESAPKTGERILATGGGLGRQVEVVTWNERIGCWNAETCTLDDHNSDPDGYNRPTLWADLPTPPASKDT